LKANHNLPVRVVLRTVVVVSKSKIRIESKSQPTCKGSFKDCCCG